MSPTLRVASQRQAYVLTDEADLARFDGPGGSLVPEVVADAVAGALRAGLCQRGGPSAPGLLTDRITAATPDLTHTAALGAHPALVDLVWDEDPPATARRRRSRKRFTIFAQVRSSSRSVA